jgi:hypothetical protein
MSFESLNGSKIWRRIDELTAERPQQSLPINAVFFGFLTDPKQSRPAIEPYQSFFPDIIIRHHMQKKFVLINPQKGIARLSFHKCLAIQKWVGPRRNKLHYESLPSDINLFDCLTKNLRSPEGN